MQCSWKAVVLLALASIAIQYTAIRTFTAKPFQLCPGVLPNSLPQNCGLALGAQDQGLEGYDRNCDDLSSSSSSSSSSYLTPSYNSTRRTHILILATTRSGSSFLGQLFNQHADIFYLFEPLYHVQTALLPRLVHSFNAAERRVMLGAARDLLRSLYHCHLYFLESYIKPQPTNHNTDKMFRRGASKALCSPPACDAFATDEGECVRKCGELNMTLATEACRDKRHVAIKTVRVPEVSDLKALVEDPRLNLKVVQLVRDPRGILASRIETFRDTYRLWRVWRATGRRPYSLNLGQLNTVCEDFLSSVSAALARPAWLRGRYMLLRYEDLARNPLQKTRELYEYLGLPLERNVEDWVLNNTRGSSDPSAKHKYATVRDSAANAESWRQKLSYEIVDYTQTVCRPVLQLLGYKPVSSVDELKNLSLSLVQEKTFLPFF
ncbi:carbohydrate sulfotransferase 1-like [Aplochiton taeniatus]